MRLSYRSSGSGDNIVMLHGYLSSSYYWRKLVPHLARNYRVITIDLLGFGASPKPDDCDYSLDDHAQSVIETIMSIIGNESVTIVGHSMGALIAARIGASMPEMVSRLVLCNLPVLRTDGEAHSVFRETNWLYRAALYGRVGSVVWPIVKAFRPIYLLLVFQRRGAFSSRHTDRSRRYSLLNTVEAGRALELVSGLACPTTILMGTKDRANYAANLRTVDFDSHVRIVWVETGHHLAHSHPHVVYDAIERIDAILA